MVIKDGEIIERGNHEKLIEDKGFYFNLYMSQFKGTLDDVEFEYIKPVERVELPKHQISMMGGGMGMMGVGMHGGMRPSPAMRQERMKQIVESFKKQAATSPESAKTLDELGLTPRLETTMRMPMIQSGVIVEKDGKYYLNERKLAK